MPLILFQVLQPRRWSFTGSRHEKPTQQRKRTHQRQVRMVTLSLSHLPMWPAGPKQLFISNFYLFPLHLRRLHVSEDCAPNTRWGLASEPIGLQTVGIGFCPNGSTLWFLPSFFFVFFFSSTSWNGKRTTDKMTNRRMIRKGRRK